jgi:hypothetical protein
MDTRTNTGTDMSVRFPFPCCQCGYCCLVKQCPVSEEMFGRVPDGQHCPALSWIGDMAQCDLSKLSPELSVLLGIGNGCDVKASALAGGVEHDFAALPDGIKFMLTGRIRNGTLRSVARKDYQNEQQARGGAVHDPK